MRNEQNIQTLQRVKANAVAFYHAGDEDQDFWEQCIEDYDDEIIDIGSHRLAKPLFTRARLTVMAGIALFLIILYCAGCSKMLGGAGQMLDGFGDGVSYVGQHLQEAVKEK